MSNIAGKAYAMNVVTPLKPGQRWLARLIHWLAGTRLLRSKLLGLRTLSLIHYAGWAILPRRRWPRLDSAQPSENLHYDYYLFFSNFNGSWEQYVDSFSSAIPAGLDLMWWRNVGYPGSVPRNPFHAYIEHNQFWTHHYYSAYPLATSNDVKAACRLRPALCELASRADRLSAQEFGQRYRTLLTEQQEHLGLVAESPVVSLAHQAVVERRRVEQTEPAVPPAQESGS
ncbi:hypothetical protein E4656_18215 [Natronospirillum operosum]|uniref:Uncharacterized protein n=1 Tax=Natronospirillum operosum TaxID=2759953 RepID=A0A4Z0W531_9GAMM|nr:hypothetical protein [Natronospirillum operosum]TGG90658.1 hypothetical protein E4656_18215 [Natronospirillum operosum]